MGVQLEREGILRSLQEEFSFKKCSLSTYYVPDVILGVSDIAVWDSVRIPCPRQIYILMGGSRQ